MQACLYEPHFYEWTIWRKPNTEEKRSFFEVAWTELGDDTAKAVHEQEAKRIANILQTLCYKEE